MQALTARHVGRPAASRSARATVQAPQSPSAQPCLAPVRPVARNQSSSVTLGERPATRTVSPLRVKSKADAASTASASLAVARLVAVAPLPFSPVCTVVYRVAGCALQLRPGGFRDFPGAARRPVKYCALMVVPRPLTMDELNAVPAGEFVARVGPTFEHSPWIAERTWAQRPRPFASRDDLLRRLTATLRAASREEQLALIRAHPDLAGRLARENALTAASAAEQASAGLDRLSAGELARFTAANAEYRERFGFPFVICARLNDPAAILRAFARRQSLPVEEEIGNALGEIEKIAALRLADVVQP